MKVPILLPNIFNHSFTYESDIDLKVGDWLGTGKLAPGSWRPFKEARAYVQKLNLKSHKEWVLYCKNKLKGFKEKPQDIPYAPVRPYKSEWKGFGDWLGNKK